jgi:predicted ATPase
MSDHENKMIKSITVFISYAHEDDSLREELDKHLSLLKSQQLIDVWYDRDISAGTEWEQTIDRHLNTARIILLLISPDFMASSYCYSIEMKRAMERHEAGDARIIPVILRPVLWKSALFGKLQALPTNAEPVTSRHWHTRDEAFFAVAQGIQEAIEALMPAVSTPSNQPPQTEQPTGAHFQKLKEHIKPLDLPVQLTPLIGREQEIAEVTRLLSRDDVRLLTLTGPGGTGKTRLALQLAHDLAGDFSDGAFFVALAPITDPDLIIPTIFQALGIQEGSGQSPLERLKEYMQQQHLLLLLDNFEQVVSTAGQVADLLAACPKLKIIVTSRQFLDVRAEHEFPVPPLALPDLTYLAELEALAHNAAVALFIQRSQAVKPGFQLTPTNAPTVVEICIRLDGLPLAIELAAARMRLLSPQALLTRLSARLQLLTSGTRDVSARQQTLRNTIAWSYQLLDAQEQQLFRRLCVFVGGCTLEAVEALCTALGDCDGSVLDGVTSLMVKSLLRQTEQTEEEPRLMMLETIREYGLEVLEASGEQEATQLAHASYYLRLAEEAAKGIRGPQQTAWLQRLEREHDNLRAALQWSLEQGEAGQGTEMVLRFSRALEGFWGIRGHYSEGRTFLKRALAASKGSLTSMRASALNIAAGLAAAQGDYGEAEELSEESLALSRSLKDRRNIARSLLRQSGVPVAKEDFLKADSLMKEALALYEELGDEVDIAEALFELGWLANVQNEYQRARPLLEESLSKFREMGDTRMIASALHQLAICYDEQGNEATVHSLLQESDRLFREVGDKEGMAYGLDLSGKLALRQGDTAMARSFMEESLALYREIGDRWAMGGALDNLARIARDQGDYVAAQTFCVENLAIIIERDAKEWNNKEYIASRLEELARLVVAQGELAWAAQLWGAAEVLREDNKVPLPPEERASYEQAVAAARTRLGEMDFARAWAEGRAMTPEQVLAAKK